MPKPSLRGLPSITYRSATRSGFKFQALAGAVAGLWLSLSFAFPGIAQTNTTTSKNQPEVNFSETLKAAQVLERGKPLEREMGGETTHLYRVTLESAQYLRIAVEPRGLVLSARVLSADKVKILDLVAPSAPQDATRLSFIAKNSGQYLIELSAGKNTKTTGRYEIRIEDLRQATVEDSDRVTAENSFAEAISLIATGRADALLAAIDKYRAALVAWRKMGERREEAQTLLGLGSVSHNLSRSAEALDYYAQALSLWRALGDRGKEAQTLSGMGWTRYSMGQLQEALQNYTQALPIRRELNDLRGQAQTLTTIGQIYRSVGEPLQASNHFDQALTLARQAGDKIQEAFALNNYALLYIEWNEYEKAIDVLGHAMPLWRETGNRYGEADALTSYGIVYHDLGDLEKSLDYYERALKLYRFVGSRLGEGDVLNNIGTIYWNRRSWPQALDYLNQALSLRKMTGRRLGEAETLNNLGLVYQELGESDKALDHFTRSLTINSKNSSAIANMGRIYFERGDYERAKEYGAQALTIYRQRGDKAGEAGILGMIAEVQASEGKLDEALSNSKTAVEMFEQIGARVDAPERRTSLRGSSKSYYSLLINILTKLHQQRPSEGYDSVALEVSERARARGLLDLLREARADIRVRVDPSLLDQERALQRQLNSKEQYRARLADNDAERPIVEKEILALLTDYQDTLAKIRSSSPEYAALTQPETLHLKEIQQTVLDENSILLEYYLGSVNVLWAVTPTSISMHILPPRAEIEKDARKVYDSLVARNVHPHGESPAQRIARISEANSQYQEASARLSQTLLGPVADQLGKKRLLLVTEGGLQYIPFSVLPTPRRAGQTSDQSFGQPLIIDHEIVNLPSASVLAVLRKELASRQPAAKSLAIFADPVFSREDPRVELQGTRPGSDGSQSDFVESKLEISKFGRLRFSREEADGIAALVPASETLKATDFAATKELTFNANLRQYRILHFATHSLLNSRWPELSGVVLSLVDQKGEPQDGFLRLTEIYNLRLNADLVVLSGCQTALGKEINGEGLVGLARGFMYAGAPRVIASLWSVDDRATAALMKRFYEAVLTKRLPPAAALRAAQIDLLSEKGWHSPYYWAAFTIQGEWR
jgi:CHAT domain-containing protein/tetratricopeptide (TPR) repeat protein